MAVRKGRIARALEVFRVRRVLTGQAGGDEPTAEGTTLTSHDAVFRQFLIQADIACDSLVIHLPPVLRQRCDPDTPQLESASFTEESLRARYSDALWSPKTVSGEGYIYVVTEH